MPLANMIVDMTEYLPQEVNVAGNADIGFFEGSSTYVVVPSDAGDTLEDYTFSGYDKLEEVYIPSTIALIRSSAFTNCPALKKIVVAKTAKTLSSMYKTMPWGAPSTCEVVWDKTAKPKQ